MAASKKNSGLSQATKKQRSNKSPAKKLNKQKAFKPNNNMKKTKTYNHPRGGYRIGAGGSASFMNSVQVERLPSNTFDLSHWHKTSLKAGALYPIMALETIPGDRVQLGTDILARLAPMIAPTMDNLMVMVEYFECPNRLIWPNEGAQKGFEKFIANDPNILHPFITVENTLTQAEIDFLDHWGIPPIDSALNPGSRATPINALPFAAYQMIYNEYYRAQYLEQDIAYKLIDGDNAAGTSNLLTMRQRGYARDYFTSALPDPQKGAEVELPLGIITLDPLWNAANRTPHYVDAGGGMITGAVSQVVSGGADPGQIQVGLGIPMALDPAGSLINEATTINDLRTAEALQKWLEMFNRVGSRFKEIIEGFFDVKVEDYRLDRPEFICGTKTPIVVNTVLNTTGTVGELPQGNMAGQGIAVIEGSLDNYVCKEHGWIIGLVSVLPRASYAQGIARQWLKRTPQDYFWSQFAHLGERPIQQQEIYAYEATAETDFGYQPQYAEYRTMPDLVSGQMRTDLDYWTYYRQFSAAPTLQDTFLHVDQADINRTLAITTTDDYIYLSVRNVIRANRKIPVFGTPQLV